MVRRGPNSLIVRPIWTLGPLNAAWCKNVSHSLRCLNSQVTSKKAYKQVPAEPSLAGFAVMVQWHPQKHCPAFQSSRLVLPRLGYHGWLGYFALCACCRQINNIFGMACLACLSSVLWLGCAWFKESSSVTSSSHSWCNMRFITDTVWPSNTFNLTRQSLAIDMHGQRRFGIGSLTSCSGRQIVGALGVFSCTQMFGRFGRAKLRPFSRRQHEHRRIWLNHQLTSALKWWLEILSCSLPRVIPTNWCSLMGKQTQVVQGSFVCQKKFAYFGIVRKTWVVSRTFFEIEAVGPLVLLENFPDQFRGSLWLHFLDNAAALSNLVNGSSSVIQGDILIGATWSRIQRLQVFPWFDRVDSKSNPVDGLSGDGWMGLGRSNLYLSRGLSFALCGKSSEGGSALKPTRCWRCSSVRVGARRSTGRGSARWFLFTTYTWEPLLLTWVV